MIQLTEIEKIRLENLKRFPESILRVERRTVAICKYCKNEISLNDTSVMGYKLYNSHDSHRRVDYAHQRKCPHCASHGPVLKLDADDFRPYGGTRYQAIEHDIVSIIEYVLKERTTGIFRKKCHVVDSIKEYVLLTSIHATST